MATSDDYYGHPLYLQYLRDAQGNWLQRRYKSSGASIRLSSTIVNSRLFERVRMLQ